MNAFTTTAPNSSIINYFTQTHTHRDKKKTDRERERKRDPPENREVDTRKKREEAQLKDKKMKGKKRQIENVVFSQQADENKTIRRRPFENEIYY